MRTVTYEVTTPTGTQTTSSYLHAQKIKATTPGTEIKTLLVDVSKPPVNLTEKARARRLKAIAPQ